jgi:HSP20 family protein
MSSRDRDADDWFRRFTGGRGWFGSGGRGNLIGEFEEMRKEMERMFEETLQNVERVPKDLVREYQTPSGGKVRQLGPLVYGYSVTVGPDGKPVVREFGNVKPMLGTAGGAPQLTSEREPLADVVTTDKEVKVVVEMPGISKEDIKVNAFDNKVEISTSEKAERKYHKIVELPPDADIDSVKSNYKNGILEITFSKKERPKGKEIKVD